MDMNSALAWEKTVEWNFVRKHLGEYDFGAPIDGDREISDAVGAKDDRWQLVEFKFSNHSCPAEKNKYLYTSRNKTINVLKAQIKDPHSMTTGEITQYINASMFLSNQKGWRGQGPVWNSCVALEKQKSKQPNSLLEKSQSSFVSLYTKYTKALCGSKTIEPHFFVYADGNDFNSLLAYPYWTEWIRKESRNLRAWNEFDAKSLTSPSYGADKETFDAYVLDVAAARGYDLQAGSTDGSGSCIVLGNITGFSGSKSIARTLNQYLIELNKPKPSASINTPGLGP
jgi:hypothetical protein